MIDWSRVADVLEAEAGDTARDAVADEYPNGFEPTALQRELWHNNVDLYLTLASALRAGLEPKEQTK